MSENTTFTEKDLQQIRLQGTTLERVEEQMSRLRNGFPYLRIAAAASTAKGITKLDERQAKEYADQWNEYLKGQHTIVKFVPASGAASRMFKNLYAFLDGESSTPTTDFEKEFFDNLFRFAFFDDLQAACNRLYGKDISTLIADCQHKSIVRALLADEGLGYGSLPKGLLKFHYYPKHMRTPLEEHMVEGALYAANAQGQVNLHFTVSPEHRALFSQLAREQAQAIGTEYGVTFSVSLSEQKPSTDTIAATPDGQPFRNADGSLLFRPGGHGALIENLNDINADVVFIKNIDNVVPDKHKSPTVKWKKVLAGVLVDLQRKIFAYLDKLDSGHYTIGDLREMIQFVQTNLCCKNHDIKNLEDTELALYLKRKLNRPIRVCGMVPNVGEPGGGPFLAYGADGTIQPQILESSQINTADPEMKAMFDSGTHFNPVDLVCATKDYKGRPFNLLQFVDHETGFISHKSKNGRELKALELPGLWNGAMSDWNTVFVEVPISTFNPVKTVNDLLRPMHQ